MRLLSKPQTLILFISVILLAGLFTIALQFVSGDLIDEIFGPPTLPNRTEASTAAIILERGKLRVGVRQDVPPFGYLDTSGNLAGFDIDLAREVANRWLNDPNAIEFVAVSAADRIPRLASGDVDLLFAAMPHKRERDAFIDFSQPYYIEGQTLLIREEDRIATWADLEGRVVAVVQGGGTAEPLQQAAAARGTMLRTQTYEAYSQAFAALTAGEVDALTGNSTTLNQFARTTPGLQIFGDRLSQDYYAVGLPQADSSLRAMVNFTLQDMKADGTYDTLYRRWFSADTPLDIPISPGQWRYASFNDLPKEPIQSGQSYVETIINRGRLIAAIHNDFWPLSSVGTDGQRVGFDIDIVREFARRWLGDPNAVELIADEPSAQVDRLVAGTVDLVVAALVEQREWAEEIDFSQTYLGTPVVSLPLTVGLPQHDSLYRELVNVTLQEMKTDGTYDAIHSKWFGTESQEFAMMVIPGDAGYLLSSLNNLVALPLVRAAGDSTIERIRARGNLLRVGVTPDQAPFAYQTEDGMITGFDAELLSAVAREWEVAIEFIPIAAGEEVRQLRGGEVDLLAAGLQRSKEREADLNFSQTYFVGGASLLTKPDIGITTLRDLGDRTVAVLEGSQLGPQLQAEAEADGFQVNLVTTPSYDVALTALRQGNVAGLLADSTALAQFANNSEWIVLNNLLGRTPYSFGLPAADSYFNQLVDATLQTLKRSGTYDELYRKWFGNTSRPYEIELLPGEWPYTFAESPTTIDTPVRSKVEEIQQRGRIVAGVPFDLPPFGAVTDDTMPNGFDIDIVRGMAKRWLGDTEAVDFVPVTMADALQKLSSGTVDFIAAALPQQQGSEELIDFSQTYYRGQQALLIRTDTQITGLDALNDKTLAVLQGSPATSQVQALVNRDGLRISILPFQEFKAAQDALRAGQVDGIVGLQAILEQVAVRENGLVVLAGLFPDEPYSIGIPNYDERFRDLVNFTLQEMKLDGTYDRLYRRWLRNEEPAAIEIWPGRSYLGLDLIPMIRIPAGEFTRGNLYGFPDERAEQTLFIDEFYLDQYEVTNRQYAECVRAGRCNLPQLPRSVNFANYYAATEFGNFPVIWVTWNDASNYCAFRGKRLPTEAEWEKAARGSSNSLYPWGNEEPSSETNFNYATEDVTAVGSFPLDLSGYGVYDMGGNVREWVSDWYQWDYYLNAPQNNPIGPNEGVTKVLRGGSWNDIAIYVRATSRKNFLPESYDSNLGFRCATSAFPPSGD